jgi:hypothetical protein
VKPSRHVPSSSRFDRRVAWWSALLLLALAGVFAALFLSARLLLSLANEPGLERSAVPIPASYHAFTAALLQLRDVTPNRSEPSPRRW